VSDYQRVPHNEALYVKIAKFLSQDLDLVERYRAAVARLPKDKDEWDIDPKDDALVAVHAILEEMNKTIRKLEPGISNNDCLEARRYFSDWAFGETKLD
jgi:hypothetical protein